MFPLPSLWRSQVKLCTYGALFIFSLRHDTFHDLTLHRSELRRNYFCRVLTRRRGLLDEGELNHVRWKLQLNLLDWRDMFWVFADNFLICPVPSTLLLFWVRWICAWQKDIKGMMLVKLAAVIVFLFSVLHLRVVQLRHSTTNCIVLNIVSHMARVPLLFAILLWLFIFAYFGKDWFVSRKITRRPTYFKEARCSKVFVVFSIVLHRYPELLANTSVSL